MKKSGIYCIENLKNGKRYIGKAVDLEDRKKKHFWLLKKNYHFNNHLQNAYNKYGKKAFSFHILEYCKKENLSEKEIEYIHIFDSRCNGYNFTDGGEGSSGYKHSKKTRKKLSKSHIGKHHSEETKRKISEKTSGKNNYWYGKHPSEGTKQKLSEANSGENNPNSKLTKKQIFEILKLYYNKNYTQQKISEIFLVSRSTIAYIIKGHLWKSCYKSFMQNNEKITT